MADEQTSRVERGQGAARPEAALLIEAREGFSAHCAAAEGEIIISGLGFIFNAALLPGTKCQEFKLNLHTK